MWRFIIFCVYTRAHDDVVFITLNVSSMILSQCLHAQCKWCCTLSGLCLSMPEISYFPRYTGCMWGGSAARRESSEEGIQWGGSAVRSKSSEEGAWYNAINESILHKIDTFCTSSIWYISIIIVVWCNVNKYVCTWVKYLMRTLQHNTIQNHTIKTLTFKNFLTCWKLC